nr:hypothetical protein [Tanacetum cinerariifolium]
MRVCVVGIKSHLNVVGIKTDHIDVNTALMELVLLVNFKDNILSGYYCWRAKRFLKKTRRRLTVNGNETLGFVMSKVECYNCHKRGHFARECTAPKYQDNKHKETTRRSVPMETPAFIALVSCDGLGGYDWSDKAEEGPNYALMAYTSSTSDSKGNPQMDLQDKEVIDSGCLRHMTENMSYLTYYEEIDGGYVAFKGNPKGGKITRKGTIKTGKLEFKNEYFGRELKFNLFRVSQIVPRKNNMYSVDLKNVVPKGGFTCLLEKSTSDESKLWHRRLGHLNFKTMNKLVNGNLDDEGFFVRYSLNSKAFRVFNSRTKIVKENKNIRSSESTPNVVGSGPDWLFDIDALTRTMNYKPIVADPSKNNECNDQEKQDKVNITNNVNTISSTVNAAGTNELPFDPDMPALEDVGTFDFLNKDEDDDVVADMNNLNTTIQVCPTPTTRIQKDHPLD